MDKIVFRMPITKEVLTYVIGAVLTKDQDQRVIYKHLADIYGMSFFDIDIIMTYLEANEIVEGDIYGVRDTEPPKYYVMYTANKVHKKSAQGVIDRLMDDNKMIECERSEKLFEEINKAVVGQKPSFEEIRIAVEASMGKKVNWAVLAAHLLQLQKEKKIEKGFVDREGYGAEYYHTSAN